MADATNAAQSTPNAAPVENAQAPAAVSPEQKLYPEGGAQPASADAAKGAEQKPVEAPAEAQYDLKLPEGSTLGEDRLKDVLTYAKEQKLDPKVAQDLINREDKLLRDFVQKQQETVDQEIEKWREASHSDKEIGGERLKESAELAKKALKQFASPELIGQIESTGYGNHPEVIRMLARIGKSLSNDKIVIPGAQSSGKKSMEEIFYGGTKN